MDGMPIFLGGERKANPLPAEAILSGNNWPKILRFKTKHSSLVHALLVANSGKARCAGDDAILTLHCVFPNTSANNMMISIPLAL